jgi:hypothetical protein
LARQTDSQETKRKMKTSILIVLFALFHCILAQTPPTLTGFDNEFDASNRLTPVDPFFKFYWTLNADSIDFGVVCEAQNIDGGHFSPGQGYCGFGKVQKSFCLI